MLLSSQLFKPASCVLPLCLCAESQLSARLDKRRSELERAEKRLATLAGVRPAYMDEYEALTGQLQVSQLSEMASRWQRLCCFCL
jgi:flagellar biosynthesis chaperone FliJ